MSSAETDRGPIPRLRFPEFRTAGPWEVKRLGEGIRLISGQHLGPREYSADRNEYPYFTGPSDFTSKESSVTKWVSTLVSPKIARRGDILVTVKGNGVGELWRLMLPEVAMGRQLMAVRGTKFNPGFLFYLLLQNRAHLTSLAAGNMIPGLSRGDLLSIRSAFPNIDKEQQKIADCLTSLDDLIRAEGERLAALRRHKTGLMQQLFPAEGETTPRLRFPKFRDAGPWEVKRLGEVCEILDNMRKPVTSTKRKPGPYPYYGASGAIDYIDEFIFDERLLLIGEDGAKWGPFERTAFIVEGKYWVNNHAHALRPIQINDVLLENFLNATDVSVYVTGAAPPKLTLENLKAIRVPVPPKREEQQKIADCLTSLDDLIRAEGERLETLKRHKKGLMQQLFPQEVG